VTISTTLGTYFPNLEAFRVTLLGQSDVTFYSNITISGFSDVVFKDLEIM